MKNHTAAASSAARIGVLCPYPAKQKDSGRLRETSLGVQLTVKLCFLY